MNISVKEAREKTKMLIVAIEDSDLAIKVTDVRCQHLGGRFLTFSQVFAKLL